MSQLSCGLVRQQLPDICSLGKRTPDKCVEAGTIHDLERSLTHKRQICDKIIVEGKSVEQTARETNLSPGQITRYVKVYNRRILASLRKGLTPQETFCQ